MHGACLLKGELCYFFTPSIMKQNSKKNCFQTGFPSINK